MIKCAPSVILKTRITQWEQPRPLTGDCRVYNVTIQAMVCGEQMTKTEMFQLHHVEDPPYLDTGGRAWKTFYYSYTTDQAMPAPCANRSDEGAVPCKHCTPTAMIIN